MAKLLLCILLGLAADSWAARSGRVNRQYVQKTRQEDYTQTGSVVYDQDSDGLVFIAGADPLPEGTTPIARGAYVDSAKTDSNFGKAFLHGPWLLA